MKLFFACLFFLFPLSVFAQQATLISLQSIGGSGSESIVPQVTKTEDGGFIIAVSSNSDSGTGNIDSFCAMSGTRGIFVKYNANASILEWSKCYLLESTDTGLQYMFPQTDGGTVLGGEFLSSSGWGFYICKQDALGNIVWSHAYSKGNSPLLEDVIATSDGGYLMTGTVYYTDTNFTVHNSGSMNADIGVLKVDSLGNKQWSEAIGGNEDDEGAKAISIPGVGYYIFGYTLSNDYDCTGNHGGADAYLARLDNAGNIIWHNDLGGSNDDGGGGGADNGYACADGHGGIIMVAVSASSDGDVSHHINPGGENIWAIDVDSSNSIVWNNCYGGGGVEFPNSVCMATDGSIWIAGQSQTIGGDVDTAYGSTDAWIVHADSVGNFINEKVLGSNKQDDGYMIYPLSNGTIITGGYFSKDDGSFSSITDYSSSPNTNAFLATFSPEATSIEQVNSNDNTIKIYPNPTDKQVTITAEQNGNYDVVITNAIGQKIYQTSFIGKINIAVNEWQRGVYYLQAVNESGYSNVQKLIVQ